VSGLALSGQDDQPLMRAFPRALAGDVAAAASVMPAGSIHEDDRFRIWVDGEELAVPERIYHAEPGPGMVESLAPRAQLVLRCLYTRHHEGFVRQRNLERVVSAPDAWVVPYVVRLVGEYIVEIIEVIAAGLPQLTVPGSPQRALYGRFAADNPAFIDLTAARVTSYWDEYYRRGGHPKKRYRSVTDYPGRQLIDALQEAGREHTTAE
jgi:hypothetical protein